LTQGQYHAVVGTQTWRLADLGSKHMLLREGIGWGNMPEPMVREDLEQGLLVRLDMPELKSGSYRLQAIYRTDTPPGPAGSWLIARFEAQAAAAEPASRPKRKRTARGRCGARAARRKLASTRVEAQAWGAEGDDLQQSAGDGEVLEEMDELVLVGEMEVEEDRRRQREDGERRGHRPRPVAEDEREP